jgi:hypothetical protein
MKIEKLKVGDTIYDVRPSSDRFRRWGKWSTWQVKVLEINLEKRELLVSWNTNKPKWVSERRWKKYRYSQPKND